MTADPMMTRPLQQFIYFLLLSAAVCSVVGLLENMFWFFDLFNHFRPQAIVASLLLLLPSILYKKQDLYFPRCFCYCSECRSDWRKIISIRRHTFWIWSIGSARNIYFFNFSECTDFQSKLSGFAENNRSGAT